MLDRFGNWIPDYPGQQPWQDKQFMDFIDRQRGNQSQAPAQVMTSPTIKAEIIQINDPAEVDRYRMQPGDTQIFVTRAEDLFIVREQGQAGYNLKMYPLQPPEPPKPPINPDNFVTREEFNAWRAQLMGKGDASPLSAGGEH